MTIMLLTIYSRSQSYKKVNGLVYPNNKDKYEVKFNRIKQRENNNVVTISHNMLIDQNDTLYLAT